MDIINIAFLCPPVTRGGILVKKLRSGFTTGACAAAAAKAAVLAWQGIWQQSIEIMTPQGRKLNIPFHAYESLPTESQSQVIKDAGDDPDITNGVKLLKSRFWQCQDFI